jgi:hypothetical protein
MVYSGAPIASRAEIGYVSSNYLLMVRRGAFWCAMVRLGALGGGKKAHSNPP